LCWFLLFISREEQKAAACFFLFWVINLLFELPGVEGCLRFIFLVFELHVFFHYGFAEMVNSCLGAWTIVQDVFTVGF
jgi:cytosine/uracil/thiamine/allantoin permease